MNESTKNTYLFPIPQFKELQDQSNKLSVDFDKDRLEEIAGFKIWRYSPAHVGIFEKAIDIFVPEGSEVLATHDGTVIEMTEQYDEYGNSFEYADKVNFFSVKHDNDEVSQYTHILKNSLSEYGIKVGDKVTRGQVIAKTGRNGWMSHDHLHYVVLKPINGIFTSLDINFEA